MNNLRWNEPSTPQRVPTPLPSQPAHVNHLRQSRSTSFAFVNSTPSSERSLTEIDATNTSPALASSESPSGKRRRASTGASRTSCDENIPPPSTSQPDPKRIRTYSAAPPPASPLPKKARKYAKRTAPKTDAQRIHCILSCISAQRWSLSEFMHQVFRWKDEHGEPLARSQTHSQMVSSFLGGRTDQTVGGILDAWLTSPDGRMPKDSDRQGLMYSTTVPYLSIKDVRPTLTSFAVQVVGQKLMHEAEDAIKRKSGLHAHPSSKDEKKALTWKDAGEDTVPHVGRVLRLHQPVTYWLMEQVATRKPRIRNGAVVPVRKRRPVDGVVIHSLAALDFCRSDRANLLPLSRGLLYFGTSAPVELIAYNSRIGNTPSYSTIYKAYESLSRQEAKITKAHGSDPSKFGFLIIDNVQNYARIRDQRIGRENKMNVGIAGIYIEGEGAGLKAEMFDLADRRLRIAENKRHTVTVESLLGLIDQDDADRFGTLQWIEALARCIPELKPLLADVRIMMSASDKLTIPVHQSVIHPLGSSGKKETIPTELKAALLDFFEQIGQTTGSYLHRKIVVGGDGLTYAMLLQLMHYLQFGADSWRSMEVLEPQLQVWHAKWTNQSRIFQTHWGKTSGKRTNPSTLGHSAEKIGRPTPSALSKVEFYTGSEILFTVLDARLIDCWSLAFKTDDIFSFFAAKAAKNELPSVEKLLPTARLLHRSFATARGRDCAVEDVFEPSLPRGSPWIPIPIEKSSLESKKPVKKKTKKEEEEDESVRIGPGDHVLAQSIDFFRDALNARKMSHCVAEGGIGRVYECIKYMLFTFAGSSHSNYMGYVLETILTLELESSPGLRDALLRCLLLNLLGLPGHFAEGDFVMEFFNRLLEDMVEHKTAEFDDNFIRNVVSRNLRQIAALKVAWRVGAGMDPKSSKHKDPHTNPEMRTLLSLYRSTELHKYRRGRIIDDRDTDDFAKGVKRLQEGTLRRFIEKSLNMRGQGRGTATPVTVDEEEDGVLHNESQTHLGDGIDSELDNISQFAATSGSMIFIDGELVIDRRDMLDDGASMNMDDDDVEVSFEDGWDQSDNEDSD